MAEIRVIGMIDGHAASVAWQADALLDGDAIAVARVLEEVELGSRIQQTPTGPTIRASLATPEAALLTMVSVFDGDFPVEVAGDVPDLPIDELPRRATP